MSLDLSTFINNDFSLTPAEFRILAFLFKNYGKNIQPDQLMDPYLFWSPMVAIEPNRQHIKKRTRKLAKSSSSVCI